MKNLLFALALFLSVSAQAQVLATSTEERAKAAVRADIEERVSARKVLYQPGEFQISPYANTENNAAFVGGTVVVHRFQTKDSTDFMKPYNVSYLVTRTGKVYVLEVFNPRR